MTTNRRKLSPITTMRAFEMQALSQDQQLRAYRVSHACWHLLDAAARINLSRHRAELLKAINPYSRIEFTRALVFELSEIASKCEAVYFVTIISNQHAGALKDLSGFDIKRYRKWVRAALGNLDHIGLADLAYYYRSPFLEDGSVPFGSWHCHVIVWNTSPGELQKLKRQLNFTELTFVPGAMPFHYQARRPEEVAEMVFYMAKGIVSEYSAFPISREIVDQTSGEITKMPSAKWRNQKRKIGPAALIKAINCVGPKDMKDLCIAGGSGKDVKRKVIQKSSAALREAWSQKERVLLRNLENF